MRRSSFQQARYATVTALLIGTALFAVWMWRQFDPRSYYHFDASFPEPFGDSGTYDPDLSDAPAPTRVYGIVNGQLVGPKDPADHRMWTLYSTLLPSSIRSEVVEFDSTDNTSATAYSIPIDEADSQWLVSIADVNYYFGPDGRVWDRGFTIHSLVHEIGHVITLGHGAVDYYVSTSTCPGAIAAQGCIRHGTFLAAYAARFWPNGSAGETETSGRYGADRFVSPYAANSLEEDMAETWAAFVLLPKPPEDSIADQKVLFFYGDPSMVAAREEIVERLGRIQ